MLRFDLLMVVADELMVDPSEVRMMATGRATGGGGGGGSIPWAA